MKSLGSVSDVVFPNLLAFCFQDCSSGFEFAVGITGDVVLGAVF